MRKLSVGDKIRFLNTVGGGIVKGFRGKQIAIVEDEHGFDVPVLVSECVVIEPAENERLKTFGEHAEALQEKEKAVAKPEATIVAEVPAAETAEGENITVCLAYLPTDIKNLTTTKYECYFVNDSNYCLFFNYMCRENNTWKSRYCGSVEPNTKIFLEEFGKEQLNEIEKVCVQFIAFKHRKPFRFKNPCSVELRIDTVKFYKLHCFTENDYFDEEALIRYIIRDDIPEKEIVFSAGDLERAMKEKRGDERRPLTQPIGKKKREPVIEIDLHINQLLDTTAGMDNTAILEYQIGKFKEVMEQHLHHKNQKIVFIHGKGDGVLKSALVKELKKSYPKCYYQDASFKEYGFGATMVIIK